MLALLRAWAGAVLVWIVGMMVMVRLLPHTEPGESISYAGQAYRVHLPWFVISVLMVLVAGVLYPRGASTRMRSVATLPVPALAILTGAAAGLAGATSTVSALLYLAEGILGVLLGLFVTRMLSKNEEETAGYW